MWCEIAQGWFTKTVVSCHLKGGWIAPSLLILLFFCPVSSILPLPSSSLTCCSGIELFAIDLEYISNQMLGGTSRTIQAYFYPHCFFSRRHSLSFPFSSLKLFSLFFPCLTISYVYISFSLFIVLVFSFSFLFLHISSLSLFLAVWSGFVCAERY